eukprot:3038895-Prymnesium_polylepis.2
MVAKLHRARKCEANSTGTVPASASGMPSKLSPGRAWRDPSATPGCAPRLAHTLGRPPTAGRCLAAQLAPPAPLQRLTEQRRYES